MFALYAVLIILGLNALYIILKLSIIRLFWNTALGEADPLVAGLKLIDNHKFACPNCGGHFSKLWWFYAFGPLSHRATAVLTFKKTNFKCPHCGKYDTCVLVENEEDKYKNV